MVQQKAEQKAKEIAEKFGVNYEVQKLPLKSEGGVKSPYFGIFNPQTEEFLNCVKESYRPVQNTEILQAVIAAVQKFGELNCEQTDVKELNGGRKLLMEIPIADGKEEFHGDRIKRSVTVVDSKDGTSRLTVGLGTFVMSCENGLYRLREDEKAVRAMHTQSIEGKIEGIQTVIPEAIERVYELQQKFDQYRQTPASIELVHELSRELLGVDREAAHKEDSGVSSRKLNQVEALYENVEKELNEKGSNLWGVLNGVTRWTSHEKSAPRRENGRIESLSMGSNAKVNDQALAFVDDAYFKS